MGVFNQVVQDTVQLHMDDDRSVMMNPLKYSKGKWPQLLVF